MGKRRKKKALSIRVVGVLDSGDSLSAPCGSVLTLSLDELLQSRYTDEYADASQPLWIQIENASHKELDCIGEHFGLHPLTVEALQTKHTREKLEIFSHYLFLVFHALHGGQQQQAAAAAAAAAGNRGRVDWTGGGGSAPGSEHWIPRGSRQHQHGPMMHGTMMDPAGMLNPRDLTRDQAERMQQGGGGGGGAAAQMGMKTPPREWHTEHVHEGSSLLSNQATAKYYGGSTDRQRSLEPSPVPPRRHKSNAAISALQNPVSSPAPSFTPRGTHLGLPASASSAGVSDDRTLPVPPVFSPPSRSPSHNLPTDMYPAAMDRFRMFPEHTLMPGSPQSSHAQSEEDDEDEDDDDDDDDEEDSSDDSDASSDSESDDSSSPSSRRSPRSGRSSGRASLRHSPVQPKRDSQLHNTPKQVARALRRELSVTAALGTKHPYADCATAAPAISAATAASLLSDREPLRTAPIKLVVFPHLVLSFHSSGLATVTSVAQRLERVYASSVESTAWIIHALLDSITDSLLPVVNGTATEVDALEELIYVLSGSEHRDLLKRMGMTRRRLSFLRQRLWSKRDILMSLIGKDWQTFLAGVQIPYLRDVYDHVVTLLHRVEAASDMLVSLQNTYLANVQIDVAEASNESNLVMKNLTAVGAIILPLQLVASLWGMNCQVPWQAYMQWDSFTDVLPFVSICVAMLLVTLFMTSYFRKHDLM